MLEPIDGRQDLLHFVADDMPAHHVGLAIDPLAMRLVGPADVQVARPFVRPIDQYRHYDAEAGVCQTPRELRCRGNAGGQPCQLLGSLIGVRQRHDLRERLAGGLQQQPFPRDAFEHRPADLIDAVAIRLGDEGWTVVVAKSLHPHRDPAIHDPENLLQPLPIRFHRFRVRLGRGEVPFPQPLAPAYGLSDLTFDVAVQAVHHPVSRLSIPVQRRGGGKRFDLSGG